MRRSARLAKVAEDEPSLTPSPPPKRTKKVPYKERPRPEVGYELVNDVPVSIEEPNIDLLKNPLSFKASKSFAYALYVSRNNWLSGTMFKTIWQRKPRGKRLEADEINARERMSRLCECTMVMGPHIFPAKLFIYKDDEDDEKKTEDKKTQEGKESNKENTKEDPKEDVKETEEKPAPKPNPNQDLVKRLQEMAKEDKELDELMKIVATGKATPENMTKFQQFLAKARAETSRKQETIYTPRRLNRSTSLAFELFENPQERYLLPKKAVVEVLSNGDILWSFLHIHESKGTEIWTPTTIVLQDVPDRMVSSLDGCIDKYDEVVKYMKEAMEKGERAEDQYVWYQIDKSDLALIDEIKKTSPPLQHVLPSKRQPKARPATASVKDEEGSSTPREKAPRQPRIRHTTYPALPQGHITPQPSTIAPLPPKLKLPDIDSFFIPPGGLPPLPPSLANSFSFPPIPGGPTAARSEKPAEEKEDKKS